MPDGDGGFDFPIVREHVSLPFHKNLKTLTKATLRATETLAPGATVRYYLTNDSQATWEEVTNGTQHEFDSLPLSATNPESCWKVIMIGFTATGAQTYIENLRVSCDEETEVT